MARAASLILPFFLLVAAAVLVAGFLGKAGAEHGHGHGDHGHAEPAEPEAAAPAPAAPAEVTEEATPPEPVKKSPFSVLKDVRLMGSVGAGGFSGAAVYKFPEGHTIQAGLKGANGKVLGVDADVSLSIPGMSQLKLAAAGVPGKRSSLRYSAKAVHDLGKDAPGAKVSAGLTESGAVLGASYDQSVSDDLDVILKLDVPYSFSKGTVDPSVGAAAAYKVSGGKVVGNVLAKASKGLKGTEGYVTYETR